MKNSLGARRGPRVVRHEQNRLSQALLQLGQEIQNILGRAGIQVAGRFVGHDQRRIGDNGAGNADTLLLSAGELARAMFHPVRQAHKV